MNKKLDLCICCGSKNLFPIIDFGTQALANNFHKNGLKEKEYELKLMGCESCWHTQLSLAIDPILLFKNYLYVSGTSSTLKTYFDQFSSLYTKDCKNVLDIACNDGSQLDSFKKLGCKTYGVDPAENLYKISIGKGHDVICDFWNVDVAKNLPKMDLIIAQNVFAHTSNLDVFLNACKEVMTANTLLVIQTSQADMFVNNEFDTIYHEHISFFSTNSMITVLARFGLYLNNVYKTPIHGNSYVFEISTNNYRNSNVEQLLNTEKVRYNKLFYIEYQRKALKCLFDLKIYLDSQSVKKIGYGAAAKGMTLLNAGKINFSYIVDDNPLKQDLFCPGTNIPVISSNSIIDEDTLVVVPLAWNFFDEIYKKVKLMRPNKNDIFVKYFPTLEIIQ